MKRYAVDAYENSQPADHRIHTAVGEFDTAEEAIACAKAIIDASLNTFRAKGVIAGRLYTHWMAEGTGARIAGEPHVAFSNYEYARMRAFDLGEAER